jgi:hypothetical protein
VRKKRKFNDDDAKLDPQRRFWQRFVVRPLDGGSIAKK